MGKKPTVGPLSPAKATELIRKLAKNKKFSVQLTAHAKERMEERGLIMGDILHVLKNGFVYNDAKPATRDGFFKYEIENKSPNSDNREVRVVVIPSTKSVKARIVTVMWAD